MLIRIEKSIQINQLNYLSIVTEVDESNRACVIRFLFAIRREYRTVRVFIKFLADSITKFNITKINNRKNYIMF